MKITLCLFVLACCNGLAQNTLWLNTLQPAVKLNPSFAGSNGFLRNQSYFQYDGNSACSIAFGNTFDAYIKPLKAGVALSYMGNSRSDGLLKANTLSLAYAQHITFSSKLHIIPSVQVGYVTQNLNASGMIEEGDMVWPAGGKNYFDLSAGLLVNYKNLYAGFSVFGFNQPNLSATGLEYMPVRYSATVSYNLHVSDNTLLNFSANASSQDDFGVVQLRVNAVFFKHVLVGVGGTINNYPAYDNNYDYLKVFYNNGETLSLGYHNNLLTVSMNYNAGFHSGYDHRGFSATLSLSLRNKNERKKLTNMEAW